MLRLNQPEDKTAKLPKMDAGLARQRGPVARINHSSRRPTHVTRDKTRVA
jgi:hypothetical protein